MNRFKLITAVVVAITLWATGVTFADPPTKAQSTCGDKLVPPLNSPEQDASGAATTKLSGPYFDGVSIHYIGVTQYSVRGLEPNQYYDFNGELFQTDSRGKHSGSYSFYAYSSDASAYCFYYVRFLNLDGSSTIVLWNQ